jgi:hypothetical protein
MSRRGHSRFRGCSRKSWHIDGVRLIRPIDGVDGVINGRVNDGQVPRRLGRRSFVHSNRMQDGVVPLDDHVGREEVARLQLFEQKEAL